MILGERSARGVVAVGNPDVSCQNLLDANFQLLALLGIGMLQSRYLFGAIGSFNLPMRALNPEIRDYRHDEQEGYRASKQSHAAIESFVDDYVGRMRLKRVVKHNQAGIERRDDKGGDGRQY